MPTYSYLNTETGEEFETIMSLREREEFLAANPHVKQTIRKSNLVSGVGGLKPPDGFRDILKSIKKKNSGSTIETF